MSIYIYILVALETNEQLSTIAMLILVWKNITWVLLERKYCFSWENFECLDILIKKKIVIFFSFCKFKI